MGNCEEELPKKPVGRLSVNCWPTVGRLLADRWPTGFALNIGYLSAEQMGNISWLVSTIL